MPGSVGLGIASVTAEPPHPNPLREQRPCRTVRLVAATFGTVFYFALYFTPTLSPWVVCVNFWDAKSSQGGERLHGFGYCQSLGSVVSQIDPGMGLMGSGGN